jgi:hypothetical protein
MLDHSDKTRCTLICAFYNPLNSRAIISYSIDFDHLGSFVTIFVADVVLIWYYIERICFYTIFTSDSTGLIIWIFSPGSTQS